MPIDYMNHYAFQNIPTIYDEEALTVLELCGRLGVKLNELIKIFNDYEKKTDDRFDKLFPAEVKTYVDKWLDEHPEATSTVQDGSLNIEKLSDTLKQMVTNNYITPQMFGVKGDGVTDDTAAFQSALDAGLRLFVPDGTYNITGALTSSNSVIFDKDAYINFTPSETYQEALTIAGDKVLLAENIPVSFETDARTMTVATDMLTQLHAGDFVYLINDEQISVMARETDTKRDILQILSIGDGFITFTSRPVYTYTKATIYKMNMLDNVQVDGVKINCVKFSAYSSGVMVRNAKNAVIQNCHLRGFDYAGIYLHECAFSDVANNFCEVNYRDALQYGIVISTSHNVSVYGNKCNSERTSIDVTWMSNKVTVSNNSVTGNINTHATANTVIANNVIDNGMILIRAPETIVTGNHVTSRPDQTCIDIDEMGIDGKIIIANNVFRGYCSLAVFPSNVQVKHNHFIVDTVRTYSSTYQSVLRFWQNSKSMKTEGAIIQGNIIEYVGSAPAPKYCIESQANGYYNFNIIIKDNIIKGFQNGINMNQTTPTLGDNLIIKDNVLHVTKHGILFRFTNNVQIVGNSIIGTEKGTAGIIHEWSENDTPTTGLIIKDNYIRNFATGISYSGYSKAEAATWRDNIMHEVDANINGMTANTGILNNTLYITSATGSVYQINVDDSGALSTTKKQGA